eukprot:TRINITY_DN1448_c0_g1_i2.p1 TRINITY_DN1448_c0_g1~~TRINITY_DN1448_c0_g1_i2.p1  ORF type:complete len:194 (+),score=41.23 TRINITY_DN1448_c0_g1_i2:185-766(+)
MCIRDRYQRRVRGSPSMTMSRSTLLILAVALCGVTLAAQAPAADDWVESMDQATAPAPAPAPAPAKPAKPACTPQNAIELKCTPPGCRPVRKLRMTKREANRFVGYIENQFKNCYDLNQHEYAQETEGVETATPSMSPTAEPCTSSNAMANGCTPPGCSSVGDLKIGLKEATEYVGYNERQLRDCYNLQQYDN